MVTVAWVEHYIFSHCCEVPIVGRREAGTENRFNCSHCKQPTNERGAPINASASETGSRASL